MIINVITYLGSLRTLHTLDTPVSINGDKLTADNDRVSTGFDGFDDCPTKGDEFEHLLELFDESSLKK